MRLQQVDEWHGLTTDIEQIFISAAGLFDNTGEPVFTLHRFLRGPHEKESCMLNSVRKIGTAVALTGALAVATATPSEAQWFGRGWGWGAPVAAGIGLGLAGAALAGAAFGSGYYGGYGYPAYGYNYSWGYPAYGAGYGPAYASYGYNVGYGYGGPAVYAGYDWGDDDYGYAGPSYYTRSHTYASPSYRTYRQARRYVAAPTYARARTYTAERSYAMAPRAQRYSQINRSTSHGRLIHTTTAVPRARTVGGSGITSAHVSQRVSGSTAAPVQRHASNRAASASVGTIR